ncbi:MAG: T9SS type A sorting domain-containing protein [Bacteroidota bacterium]
MIKNTLYLTLVLLFISSGLFAQMHKCGVDHSMGAMIQDQLIFNRNEMRDVTTVRNATVYLPVRFFLVARSDGSERVRETTALNALCTLNGNYADQEIQFFIEEIKYLNNTQVHTNPISNFGFNTISAQMNNNYDAINIFLVKEAGGGAAAYYQPPAGPSGNDWVVSGESYANDFETLTHEIGHFFSLNHPFYGWESEGWNLADHGNPVGTFSPDGVRNEYADGTNSDIAGDMIEDTPADYRFDFPGNDGCTYNLNVMDPKGDLISPDITNFMNYGSCNTSDYHFTDDQKAEIQNSLNSSSRAYIPKDITPNLNEITSSPVLLSPQSLERIETYNYVVLEWAPVDNAEHYLIELNNTETGQEFYIEDDTELVLTNLLPEETYFWRVKAYTDYSTCQSPSGQQIFRTGSEVVSDTNEIPGLNSWTLAPNPVKSGSTLLVNVDANVSFSADILITTITGQTVQQYRNQDFADGITAFEIDTNGMPAGTYLVSLFSEEGVQTRRASIY